MSLRIASDPQPGPGRKLLRDSDLEAFFWTQFLGGFNGSSYKILSSLLAVFLRVSQRLGCPYLVFAGAILAFACLLCSGPAGELADYLQTRWWQATKAREIVTTNQGWGALLLHRVGWLLGIFFFLVMQQTRRGNS